MDMPNEFFTVTTLATYAGLVAATFVLVAFFKPWLKPVGDVWIRPFAALVALVIQFFVLLVAKNMSAETIGLAVINAPLVAVGAAGVHEIQKDPRAQTPQTIKPPDAT